MHRTYINAAPAEITLISFMAWKNLASGTCIIAFPTVHTGSCFHYAKVTPPGGKRHQRSIRTGEPAEWPVKLCRQHHESQEQEGWNTPSSEEEYIPYSTHQDEIEKKEVDYQHECEDNEYCNENSPDNKEKTRLPELPFFYWDKVREFLDRTDRAGIPTKTSPHRQRRDDEE